MISSCRKTKHVISIFHAAAHDVHDATSTWAGTVQAKIDIGSASLTHR
jgi:hypothetical protein